MADPVTLYTQLTTAGEPYRIATLIVVIFIILSGFAIGLGRALGIKRLEEWGKHEIIQQVINSAFLAGLAGVTIFIMMLITSLVPASGTPEHALIGDVDCAGKNCAIVFSLNYLEIVNGIVNGFIASLSAIYAVLAPLSTLNVGFNFFISGSITPLNGFAPFLDIMGSLISALAFFVFLIFTQRSLLLFVDATAFAVFLPLGLILRSAYITRKVGGAMIAIAVGLYVVYPLLFVLNVNTMKTVLDVNVQNATLSIDDAKAKIASAGIGVNSADASSMSVDYGGLLKNDVDVASVLVNGSGGVLNSYNSVISGTESVLASLFIVLFFMPFFNLIITVIAIKEMAALFGSELNGGIAGIT